MEQDFIQLAKKIKKLLSQQKLGVLATRGTKYPYNTLVGYTFSTDLRYLYFATMKHTRKYDNILKHRHVSILIDNRSNDAKDFKDAVALTVTGEIKNESTETYQNLYLKRFPYLKDFIENPECVILPLKVDKFIYVQRFQEVLELSFEKYTI